MTDDVITVPAAIAVPGLKIAYHFQLDPQHALSYEAAVDRDTSLAELNDLLGRLHAAADRRMADVNIPNFKRQLAKGLKLKPIMERQAAEAETRAAARTVTTGTGRQKMVLGGQQNMDALKGAQERLAQVLESIKEAEVAIAYWEAIRDGREPPDPEAEPPHPEVLLAAAE